MDLFRNSRKNTKGMSAAIVLPTDRQYRIGTQEAHDPRVTKECEEWDKKAK